MTASRFQEEHNADSLKISEDSIRKAILKKPPLEERILKKSSLENNFVS